MIAGTLTAGWDQEVFDANGVDDLAIVRMSALAAFIERGTCREARMNDPALTRS